MVVKRKEKLKALMKMVDKKGEMAFNLTVFPELDVIVDSIIVLCRQPNLLIICLIALIFEIVMKILLGKRRRRSKKKRVQITSMVCREMEFSL